MMTLLAGWQGSIEVNGRLYHNYGDMMKSEKQTDGEYHIILRPKVDRKKYKIKVKSYMTKKATPQFEFMAKWNNDVPMPKETMTGYFDDNKQTRGMVYFVSKKWQGYIVKSAILEKHEATSK